MCHGYDATLPSDIPLNIKTGPHSDISVYKQIVASKLASSRVNVLKAIVDAQKSQKSKYDKRPRVKKTNYKVGDLVLVFKDSPRDPNKVRRPYQGPYRVIAVNRPNIVILKKNKPVTVHFDKCKHYLEHMTLPLRGTTALQLGEGLVSESIRIPQDLNIETESEELELPTIETHTISENQNQILEKNDEHDLETAEQITEEPSASTGPLRRSERLSKKKRVSWSWLLEDEE